MSEMPAFTTSRYSLLLRRILEHYREEGTVRVNSTTYAGEGIDDLLARWCTNRRIRATRDFAVFSGGAEVLGWHDHPREMWVAPSERSFFDQLCTDRVIRYHQRPLGGLPKTPRRTWRARLAAWLGLTEPLQPTRAAQANEQREPAAAARAAERRR